MKIAVLGAGTMGTTYISNIILMDDVSLVGILDNNAEALQKGVELGNTQGFDTLESLMETVKPDLVCVCLPTYLHKEFVIKLAAYKVNIVCEKPLALSLEDTIEMENACAEAGVKLFVGHVLRFFPNYVDLKNRVESGQVGAVKVARAKRYSSFPKGRNDWFSNSALSGGVILDLMIHDIDFMRWTMGEVESVYTLGYEAEGKQVAYVTLKFESGAMAQVSGFWGYGGQFTTTAELACEKGLMRLSNVQHQSLQLITDQTAEGSQAAVQVPGSPTAYNPYYYELRHFIQCIQNDTTPIITVHDAKQAVVIANAAIESLKTGSPVKVEKVQHRGVTV